MRRFLSVLILIALPSLAHAQSFQLQYAAKFVCGKADSSAQNFAPGTYFTTINVYNTSSPAIDKRIVVALPDEKAGGSTKTSPSTCRPAGPCRSTARTCWITSKPRAFRPRFRRTASSSSGL